MSLEMHLGMNGIKLKLVSCDKNEAAEKCLSLLHLKMYKCIEK